MVGLRSWITTNQAWQANERAILDCPSDLVVRGRFFGMQSPSFYCRRKNLFFAARQLESVVFVLAVVVTVFVAAGRNVPLGAFFAFAKIAVGHARVPIELRQWLWLVAFETHFEHGETPFLNCPHILG